MTSAVKSSAKDGTVKTPVLPWMRVPVTIEAGSGVALNQVNGLDSRLLTALNHGRQNYKELFPVQSVVWAELAGGCSTAHDLCIAAPTGSGKTLAYVLPIVNGLAVLQGGQEAASHRLQALVVVPTRDLAAQVHQVLSQLCPAVGLTLGLAAAQQSLEAEAAVIMGTTGPTLGTQARQAAGSTSTEPAWGLSLQDASGAGGTNAHSDASARCADVLVATPGRLMAHLKQTPGFTLKHLRYLAVDETDRLLRQSYQEWLPQVISQLSHPEHFAHQWAASSSGMQGEVTPSSTFGVPAMPFGAPRTVKLIVSATLTRDPSKLQRLALHCPRYVATSAQDHRYHLPRNLQEFKLPCSAARKPLVLLALLKELSGQATVVFASSLETTHKLYLMLQAALMGTGAEVAEFASTLTSAQRAMALQKFKAGQIKVLVASDAMTRGMDIQNVENVINYDAPVYAKTYVHRAGRTARAGRAGRVFTLLRDQDVRHFKQMLRKADNTYVKDYKLPQGAADAMKPALDQALKQASDLLAAEEQDDVVTLSRRPAGAPDVPAKKAKTDS